MGEAEPKTALTVLRAAERYLRDRRVDEPRRSAELLLAAVLGVTRLQLYLDHDRPMAEDELGRMRELLARRGRHEPIGYLLGSVEFCSLAIAVDRRVLIPRPETEGLVELAVARLPRGGHCLDLGTGSGAIALALAHARPDLTLTAVDISEEALAVARHNAAATDLAARCEFLASDWWSALAGRRFAALVANPPYVDPDRPDLLAADVRDFEPHLALFGTSGDPVSAYRSIVAGIPDHLDDGAWCLLETGVGVAEPALALLRGSGFLADVELLRDLAGLPRYLVARHRRGAGSTP